LLQLLLPRLRFHLSLVDKLLSLRLVSFEQGNLGGQTISFDFNEVFLAASSSTWAISKVLSAAA
jgi:hypothetical protein